MSTINQSSNIRKNEFNTTNDKNKNKNNNNNNNNNKILEVKDKEGYRERGACFLDTHCIALYINTKQALESTVFVPINENRVIACYSTTAQ